MSRRGDADKLRRAAESRLKAGRGRVAAVIDSGDTQRLVHELQVQQIELEMQNEELRRTRDALEESRSQYVDLYEFAPVGYLTIDADGIVVRINLRGSALLGTARSEVQGRQFASFVDLADRDRWHQQFEIACGESGHGIVELRMRRNDGSQFDAQLDYVCEHFEAGGSSHAASQNQCQIRITLTDISARKALESQRASFGQILQARLDESTAELRQAAENMRLFIKHAPLPMAMFDREMNYLVTSDRWLDEYGRGQASLIGLNHYALFPNIPDHWRSFLERALAGEILKNDQDLWIWPDGSQHWLRWTVLPWRQSVDSEPGGIIISAEDVTQSRRVDAALRISQDDLVRAQAVGNIGSWRLDFEHRELTWTRENYRILGLPDGSQLDYDLFLSCVHPEDRALVDGAWRALRAGTACDFEHRLLVNGQVKWVREKAEVELDEAGRARVCFGVTQDITRQRLAAECLAQANQSLAQVADERAVHLRELSAELSRVEQCERDRLHEVLHDDLQPLLVAARLRLSGLRERTAKPEILRVVREVTEQISGAIQTARSLSSELSPPLLREQGLMPALDWLGRRFEQMYGLKVIVASTGNIEIADMDIRQLCFKAVRELLINVVKYANVHSATIDVGCLSDTWLQLAVRDEGAGYDLMGKHGGSGLAGIARRLGMLGGVLTVSTAPGAGVTAVLRLPLVSRGKAGSGKGVKE